MIYYVDRGISTRRRGGRPAIGDPSAWNATDIQAVRRFDIQRLSRLTIRAGSGRAYVEHLDVMALRVKTSLTSPTSLKTIGLSASMLYRHAYTMAV